MDRREFVKGAAVLPIAAAGVVTGKAACGAPVSGNQPCDPPFDVDAELRKAYDPVAVLEAMREAGMSPEVYHHSPLPGWSAIITPPSIADADGFRLGAVASDEWFPDFLSAVQWLHRQAAAADAEFGREWPVPE